MLGIWSSVKEVFVLHSKVTHSQFFNSVKWKKKENITKEGTQVFAWETLSPCITNIKMLEAIKYSSKWFSS